MSSPSQRTQQPQRRQQPPFPSSSSSSSAQPAAAAAAAASGGQQQETQNPTTPSNQSPNNQNRLRFRAQASRGGRGRASPPSSPTTSEADDKKRQHYFSFAGSLVAVPHYGKVAQQGQNTPEDDNIMLRRRALLRRMVNTLGSEHGFDSTTPPTGGKNALLRRDWEVAAETKQRETHVWLKQSTSPFRKPSLFFSRSVVTEESAPPGAFPVPVSRLGRALPLFKVTSPSCEYFALRLPLLKGGFKRVADAESFIDANVMWGKSWSMGSNTVPDRNTLAAALRPQQEQQQSDSSAAGATGFMLPSTPAGTVLGFEFCKRPVHRFQKVNHFAGSHKNLGCKSGMAKNLDRLAREFKDDPAASDFVPKTFRLPEELKQLEAVLDHADPKSPWILKPARGSCGRGLRIFHAGDDDRKAIIDEATQPRTKQQYHQILNGGSAAAPAAAVSSEQQQQQKGPTALVRPPPYVVQQYMANPLLVNSRKFDFRVYVVATSFDPLVCYIHHSGLVRFAAKSYDSDVSNVYSHLTNYSVGRKLEAEEKYSLKQEANDAAARANNNNNNDDDDDDNADASINASGDAAIAAAVAKKEAASNFTLELKWSMERFNEYVTRTYGGKAACDKMWVDVEDIIVKTLFAAQPEVCRMACSLEGSHDASIELYGFDVMLDENLKPWLIEVNTLPSLESSSQFDYNVKSNVVTDILNLSQLQLYDRHPDVFSHVEQQSVAAYQAAAVDDSSSSTGTDQKKKDDADEQQQEVQQQQQPAVNMSYMQAPHPSVSQHVHSIDSLFDTPAATSSNNGGAEDDSNQLPQQDSDVELLLRKSSPEKQQQQQQSSPVPPVIRPRDRGFMGRTLPPDQDCTDTVARVRDELKAMGGFRLMFPTQDKVERLGKFCSKYLREMPRNQALWRDVQSSPEVYAAASATAFPRWQQGLEASMDSDEEK